MSLEGTVHRTFFLLCLLVGAGSLSWGLIDSAPEIVMPVLWGSLIGGFVVAMVTIFKKTLSPFTAPVYAVLEGVLLGVISSIYNQAFEGIVLQAVILTAGILFALLAAYRSGLISPTENFKLGVVAATGGVCLLYLFNIVMTFVFGQPVSMLHDTGPVGIGISVVIVGIAALNLVLDFDFIEQGVENGLPQYMEWYAAFGLMVTLVWLYLEILRLLSKLRQR